ncbi:MAG: hypothetical protein GXO49_05670, partial [Chlorobi bacterium]|nr:hypothetical protein [Chlorobiota bacterium]
KFIEKKIIKNRKQVNKQRESLYKLSAEKYFNSLNLPELDTIKFENFSFNKHSYKTDFTDIDKKIFKLNVTKQMQVSYLSKQNISKYTTISVSYLDDCVTNIYLYTIDKQFNLLDYKLIYSAFPFPIHVDSFKYKNYIIYTNNELFYTHFNSDSSFSIIKKEYFTLKDTITNKKHIEIGNEFNATYKINTKGKFIEIDNKSFQKEYIEPLYKILI